jgi:hypothetical protein
MDVLKFIAKVVKILLMFKMSEFKRIALETRVKSITIDQNPKIIPGALKYDRIYITNLKSIKSMG